MPDAKILVVDDEPQILKAVEQSLIHEGFRVLKAIDGEEALAVAQRERPDLIVLDLMLPKLDGFEVCRRLRQVEEVPIIILSAKDTEIDKVVGFNLGIDDYLTKPFSPAELVLRIKAVLRRSQGSTSGSKKLLRAGELEMDVATRSVSYLGRPLELTVREFAVLWLLASHPNQVFTREQLLNQVWDTDYAGDSNMVTVLIKRLREKVEVDPSCPKLIKTVWGLGYKLEP